jgi:phage/plasmid-associated DNA primase
MYALKNSRGYANGFAAQKYTMLYGSENKKRDFSYYWNSLKKTDEDKQITLASLDTWCREDNEPLFNKLFPDKRNLDNFVEDDREASDYLIANDLKGICVYSQGNSYIKKNENIWTNDKITFDAIGMTKTQESNLKKIKINSKGEEIITPYCSNNGSATAVWKTISNKMRSKQDENFAEKFRSSTKGKICFKNGVLDFKTGLLTAWSENIELFTTNMINYDYEEIQNEENIQKVFDTFHTVFGEQTNDFLHFLARAIAGHIGDKRFGLFIGSRNCGKGVVERLLRDAFEGYIASISSSCLKAKGKNAGDDIRNLGWIQDIEQKRLCFLQECDVEDTKLNGALIKTIASGGDAIQNRKNYQDSVYSYLQTTIFMMANLIPPFAKGTEDCMNEAITFTSQNEYVSQDDIDKKIAEGAPDSRIALLKVGNPNIKEWFVQNPELKQALTHLLLRHYKDFKVPKNNKFKEDETTEDIASLILTHFKYEPAEYGTPNFISNKELKAWGLKYGVNYAQHLKQHLIHQGGRECVSKDNKKSVRGIKNIVRLDVVDDDKDDKVDKE